MLFQDHHRPTQISSTTAVYITLLLITVRHIFANTFPRIHIADKELSTELDLRMITMLDALSLDQMHLIFSLVSDWQIEKVVDPLSGEDAYCCEVELLQVMDEHFKEEGIDRYCNCGTFDEYDEVMVKSMRGPFVDGKPAGRRGVVIEILFDDYYPYYDEDIAEELPVQEPYYPNEAIRKERMLNTSRNHRAVWKRCVPVQASNPSFDLFPHMHTTRGRLIMQHILLDLAELAHGRPIQYLALYTRDLLMIAEQS